MSLIKCIKQSIMRYFPRIPIMAQITETQIREAAKRVLARLKTGEQNG